MLRPSLALALALVPTLGVLAERDARACGGCFTPPTLQSPSDITDERMLLAVSPTQTSLYDQIQYSGNPANFAWVLPIHGTVDVGLSADVLFDAIDVLTATQINPPPYPCPLPPSCGSSLGFGGSSSGSSSSAGGSAAPPVTVTKSENVGPYATVQLHSTDPQALNTWLTQNGYSIPSNVTPVIDAYVSEGFDFLAMKLLPNEGVPSMRPVRVTMPGASVSLPLRMAAIGTGVTVGITIWIVSDGRYEPQNFPSFHIEDSELVWDWGLGSSNYTTLRAQHEAALGGRGWELESSLDLATAIIQAVIENGGQYYENGGYPPPAPVDAGEDYLPVAADDAGTPAMTADDVRSADIAALYAGMPGPNVRITRIRSDISQSAMTTDFILQASTDQSEVSNVRQVTQSTDFTCQTYPPCSGGGSSSSGGGATGADGGANAETSGGDFKTGAACATSTQGRTDLGVVAGSYGGLLAVVLARAVRRRRRAKTKSDD